MCSIQGLVSVIIYEGSDFLGIKKNIDKLVSVIICDGSDFLGITKKKIILHSDLMNFCQLWITTIFFDFLLIFESF